MAAEPTPANPPEGRLRYRLLTGKDDRAFCEKVSRALEDGWLLYGPPRTSYDWWRAETKVAQAVVWPSYHPDNR